MVVRLPAGHGEEAVPRVRWYKKGGRATNTVHRGYISDYKDYLLRTFKGKTNRVFIIGHSYGGKLAMSIAETLESKDNFILGGLYTLDPISINRCNYARAVLLSAGCTNAPKNPNFAERKKIFNQIKSNKGFWINYYQRKLAPMSSKFSPATNRKLNVFHTDVDSNNNVWASADRALEIPFFNGDIYRYYPILIAKKRKLINTYRNLPAFHPLKSHFAIKAAKLESKIRKLEAAIENKSLEPADDILTVFDDDELVTNDGIIEVIEDHTLPEDSNDQNQEYLP